MILMDFSKVTKISKLLLIAKFMINILIILNYDLLFYVYFQLRINLDANEDLLLQEDEEEEDEERSWRR